MAIITISREYGSEGTLIGENVSKALGYLNVDKDMIGNVLYKYGLVAFDKLIEERHNIWDRFDYDSKQIVSMLSKTMLAFAQLDNCVILGRGGFVVLNEYQNVLNVLIRAPLEQRVENITKRGEAQDCNSAEQLVKKNDEIRSNFLRVFYGIECNVTDCYNLVIDTGKLSVEKASKWIIEASSEIDKKNFDSKRSTLSLEINRILSDTVKSVSK